MGDAGARGVQVRLRPPLGRHGSFWGRGDIPSSAGGVEGRRPREPQAGGEWGGEGGGGGGGACRCSLLLRPGGRPVAPGPVPLPLRRTPLGIHGSLGGPGRRGRSGRPPVGQCGGGGGFPRYALLPRLPQGGIKVGRLVFVSGRHRAAAADGAGAEPPAGSGLCGSERAADRGRLTRGCVRRGWGISPLGAAALSGVCGPAVSPVGPRPPTGWGGGRGGGGSPLSPPRPPGAAPRWAGGGSPVVLVPGGQPLNGGGVPFPRLPSVLGFRALARVPCSPRRRRAVPAGRRGGGGPMCAGGGGLGQWSAVSGLRGSGPPLALGAPVLPPTGGGARPSAALYGGGGFGSGGPATLWGGVPRHCPLSPPPAPIAWADGARPSPPLSLVRGLGLRRWWV